MAWTFIANLKGSRGERGVTGQQGEPGLPGVNAVANDTATGTYVGTSGSATRTAIVSLINSMVATSVASERTRQDGRFSKLSDGGERFMAKLQTGQDVRLGIAGDSLSTELSEYPALIADWVAEKYPSIRVLMKRWNGTEYNADEVLNTGAPTAPRATRILRDNFSIATGDIYGTTPDVMGPAWGRSSADVAGDWSSTGAGAIASSNTPRGILLSDTGHNNTQDTVARFKRRVTTPTTTSSLRVYARYVDADNHTYLNIDFLASNTYVVSFRTRRGGVTTERVTLPALPTPGDYLFNIRLIVGPTVRLIVNGQSATYGLNSLDEEATSGNAGSSVGFGVTDGQLAGSVMEYFETGLSRSLAYQYLYVYNGGRASTTWQYQIDNAAAMYPQPLDLLVASSSHNNFPGNPSGAPSDAVGYIAKAEELVSTVQALWPDTGFLFASQNPERYPVGAAEQDSHRDRQAALAAWARKRQFGYAPGFETFRAHNADLDSLIEPDGIHPTKSDEPGLEGPGAELFAQTMIDQLAKHLVTV